MSQKPQPKQLLPSLQKKKHLISRSEKESTTSKCHDKRGMFVTPKAFPCKASKILGAVSASRVTYLKEALGRGEV